MSYVVSSNRLRCLKQVAAIGLIAVLGAGCSSDFARFDADKYTASISSNQSSADQANPYPGGVDPLTTSSVSRSGTIRPPSPTADVNTKLPGVYDPYDVGNNQGAAEAQPTNIGRQTNYQNNNIDQITSGSIQPAKPSKTSANVKVAAKQSSGKSAAPYGWTATGGTIITIRDGENLYNIAKRYGVPVHELKKANKIANANQVRAGQRIVIPIYIYSSSAPVSAPDNNASTRAARAGKGKIGDVSQSNLRAPAKPVNDIKPGLAAVKLQKNKPALDTSSMLKYQVVSGDTLGAIAGRHGLRLSQLKSANGLENSYIKVGQILVIPGKGALASVKKATKANSAAKQASKTADKIVTGSTTPKPYTKPNSTGDLASKDVDKAPARSGIDTFRWPATGRVLSRFGERRDGERNEGIDISVPEGTSVKATENGIVIYSDNELGDYGNLLLIGHDGGWVSAYAHNKSLNVKRGEKVRRGQIIAKSGRTGSAERPMIHFELRKDSNPVNPEKFLR